MSGVAMVYTWMIDGWGGGFQGKRKGKSYDLEQLWFGVGY